MHLIPDDFQVMTNWYRTSKEIPLFEDNNGLVKKPYFYPNASLLIQHEDFTERTLAEWIIGGTLILQPRHFVPDMLMNLVFANMDTKERLCLDGGPIRCIEAHKTPCVLEGLTQALTILKQGDRLSVADDKRGFHLMRMSKEAPSLLSFQYKGRTFSYRALPFGIPKGPGAFQRANMAAVNFLRAHGVRIILYLDDRLIVDKPEDGLPRNSILSMMIIIAAGGMISLNKSSLDGQTRQRFLGMDLDTETCEVSVPTDKWEKFQRLVTILLEADIIEVKLLEKVRGKAISFLIAAPMAKLHIRRMTEKITLAERNHCLHIPNDDRLRDELRLWQNMEADQIRSIWNRDLIPTQATIRSFTDASSHSGGMVIIDTNHGRAACFQFSESFARRPIAEKEAYAIWRMLQENPDAFYQKSITHFCDNQGKNRKNEKP